MCKCDDDFVEWIYMDLCIHTYQLSDTILFLSISALNLTPIAARVSIAWFWIVFCRPFYTGPSGTLHIYWIICSTFIRVVKRSFIGELDFSVSFYRKAAFRVCVFFTVLCRWWCFSGAFSYFLSFVVVADIVFVVVEPHQRITHLCTHTLIPDSHTLTPSQSWHKE